MVQINRGPIRYRALARVVALPIVVAILIAAAIAGFGVLSYGDRRQNIEAELRADVEYTAQNIRNWVADQFDQIAFLKGLAEDYYQHPPLESERLLVRDYFAQTLTSGGYAISSAQNEQLRTGNIIATQAARKRLSEKPNEWLMLYRLSPVFQQMKFRDNTIQWLHYVSNQRDFGMIYPWMDIKALLVGFGVDTVEQMYAKIYSENRRRKRGIQYDLTQPITWSSPYIDAGTGKPTVTISTQVLDGRKELIGFVGLDILLAKVPGLLTLKKRWKGRVFLVDQKGFLIAESPARPRSLVIQKFADYMPTLAKGVRDTYLSGNTLTSINEQAVIMQMLPPSPWRIIVTVPQKAIDNAVWLSWQTEAIVTALMFLGVLLSTILMYFWLIRPARLLAESVGSKMSKNDLVPRFWMPWFLLLERERCRNRRQKARLRKKIADLERELHHWQEQLSAQRTEHQSFILSISQDLRSPLRGVSGFVDLLIAEKSEQLDEEGKKIVERLRRCAHRALRIVEGLLSLSRLTRRRLVLERINLSQLFKDVIEEKCAQVNIEPEVNIEPNLEAFGDRELLRIALSEIIDNSIKFRDHDRPLTLNIGATVAADEVRYFVSDNGIGMPLQNPEMPFRPFVCLHHDRDASVGEGIGLTRVRQIIRRLGGNVWIESEENSGTTLWFTLPLLGQGILAWQKNEQTFVGPETKPEQARD